MAFPHGVAFSIELFEWGILGTRGFSRMWRAFPVLADTSSALWHPSYEWGHTFSDFGGKKVFHISGYPTYQNVCTIGKK